MPIGSPVSSQKPYSPDSIRCRADWTFFSSLRSRSRVRNSSACSSSIVARSAGSGTITVSRRCSVVSSALVSSSRSICCSWYLKKASCSSFMYSPSGIRSNCSSVGSRRPPTTTGSSLRPDERVSRYSCAAARSFGLTLCTGRAADFGVGGALSGECAGTTATVVLGLTVAGLTAAGLVTATGALGGATVLTAGFAFVATAVDLVGFCLADLAAGLAIACRAGLETGLLTRSEEHTSELQSHLNLVCRLLLAQTKPTPSLTPVMRH